MFEIEDTLKQASPILELLCSTRSSNLQFKPFHLESFSGQTIKYNRTNKC